MTTVLETLETLKCKRMHRIDVGCCGSGEATYFAAALPGKEIISIGIDPVKHPSLYPFTYFLQAAVRNCAPMEAVFYQYRDPSCSSLLKITSKATHDPSDKTKWFVNKVKAGYPAENFN